MSNDCISRQAALDAIDRWCMGEGDEGIYTIVENLPFVALQQKTGHWEWVQYDYNPKLGDWHCSKCRSVVIECVNKEDKGGIPLYKYCPQCGAKMVDPQESEEE